MLTQPLLDKLTQLGLGALRDALAEQFGHPQYAELTFEDRLGLLIDQECTHRDHKRLQRRLKAAQLPLPATLEDLDLSPARGLDRRAVLQLAQGEWIYQHLNVLVLGPTGTGKTFLACVLAHAACRADLTVRYYRTSRLLQQLALVRVDGSYAQFLKALARVPLLVLDDWLRDPLTRPQAQDLLEILDDRYGRSSTLVATQVPVTEWHARVPDPTLGDAILDRLIHNAYRVSTGIISTSLH
jgi:DNA replication protein DnaC